MSEIRAGNSEIDSAEQSKSKLELAIEGGDTAGALRICVEQLENGAMTESELWPVLLMCLPDDIEGAKSEWEVAKESGDVGNMLRTILKRKEWLKVIEDATDGEANLRAIIERIESAVQAKLVEKDAEIAERAGHYDAVSRIRDELEADLAYRDAEITEKNELIAQLYRTLETLQDVVNETSKLTVQIEENISILEKNAINQPDTVDHTSLVNERDAEIDKLKLQIEKMQQDIAEASQLATETINENDAIEANRAPRLTKPIESVPETLAEKGASPLELVTEIYDDVRALNDASDLSEENKAQIADKIKQIKAVFESMLTGTASTDVSTSPESDDPKTTVNEKLDTQEEIARLIAFGNAERPNNSDAQKLFIGAYRDYQLTMKIQSTEPIPSEGEYYDAAIGFARKVTESSDNNVRGQELNNLNDKVREMISQSIQHANNVAARAGETSAAVFEKRDGAEQEPEQKLSIISCSLEKIKNGAKNINAEIFIKGYDPNKEYVAYLVDDEKNKAVFGEISVGRQKPGVTQLLLKKCNVPNGFGQNEGKAFLKLQIEANGTVATSDEIVVDWM